jgi:hypothetical protein
MKIARLEKTDAPRTEPEGGNRSLPDPSEQQRRLTLREFTRRLISGEEIASSEGDAPDNGYAAHIARAMSKMED